MALQGMDLDVNELDVQSNGQVTDRLAELVRSGGQVLEDLRYVESERMSSRLGSYELMGVKVEVIGDVRKKIDGTWEETVNVTESLKTCGWRAEISVCRFSGWNTRSRPTGRWAG